MPMARLISTAIVIRERVSIVVSQRPIRPG
jgi:hypothetical protein